MTSRGLWYSPDRLLPGSYTVKSRVADFCVQYANLTPSVDNSAIRRHVIAWGTLLLFIAEYTLTVYSLPQIETG